MKKKNEWRREGWLGGINEGKKIGVEKWIKY